MSWQKETNKKWLLEILANQIEFANVSYHIAIAIYAQANGKKFMKTCLQSVLQIWDVQ